MIGLCVLNLEPFVLCLADLFLVLKHHVGLSVVNSVEQALKNAGYKSKTSHGKSIT